MEEAAGAETQQQRQTAAPEMQESQVMSPGLASLGSTDNSGSRTAAELELAVVMSQSPRDPGVLSAEAMKWHLQACAEWERRVREAAERVREERRAGKV